MKNFIIAVLVVLAVFFVIEYYVPNFVKNFFEEKKETIEVGPEEIVLTDEVEEIEDKTEEKIEEETTQPVKVVKQKKETNTVAKVPQEEVEVVEEEDDGTHLKFKGIAIKGSMDSFCKKLKAKGFTQIGREGKAKLFEGDFTGKTATVKVESDNDGKNVYRVIVMFAPSGDWNELVEVYNYYKDIYTKKYGNTSYQKHRNPQATDSNISAMYELWQGKVTWASRWKDTGGTIEISIEKTNGISEGVVVIRYSDSQNEAAKIQSDLEEI
jgi:hypothetical protein